jgi:hypothetical protein
MPQKRNRASFRLKAGPGIAKSNKAVFRRDLFGVAQSPKVPATEQYDRRDAISQMQEKNKKSRNRSNPHHLSRWPHVDSMAVKVSTYPVRHEKPIFLPRSEQVGKLPILRNCFMLPKLSHSAHYGD